MIIAYIYVKLKVTQQLLFSSNIVYLVMSSSILKLILVSRKNESEKVCNQMYERDNELVISCSLVHHTSIECTSSMKIRLRVNIGSCMLVKKAFVACFYGY